MVNWIGEGFCLRLILMCVCLERFHELDKRCRELDATNKELKQLNAQLEKDLLSVGGVTALFRRGPEVCFLPDFFSLHSSVLLGTNK